VKEIEEAKNNEIPVCLQLLQVQVESILIYMILKTKCQNYEATSISVPRKGFAIPQQRHFVAIPRVIAWSCVPLAGEDSAGPAGK
jgi:hypothetical protein